MNYTQVPDFISPILADTFLATSAGRAAVLSLIAAALLAIYFGLKKTTSAEEILRTPLPITAARSIVPWVPHAKLQLNDQLELSAFIPPGQTHLFMLAMAHACLEGGNTLEEVAMAISPSYLHWSSTQQQGYRSDLQAGITAFESTKGLFVTVN